MGLHEHSKLLQLHVQFHADNQDQLSTTDLVQEYLEHALAYPLEIRTDLVQYYPKEPILLHQTRASQEC